MNKGRVGEERGSKEMDGCPLTTAAYLQKAKTMLHTAGMDTPYWGEAFMYAIHAQNLLLSATNKGKSPTQVWTGNNQHYTLHTTHLHLFRSITYVDGIKWNGHGILEATPMRCWLLVWWVDKPQGYRFEDPTTCLLIASHDA
jgi:hypothetical protein